MGASKPNRHPVTVDKRYGTEVVETLPGIALLLPSRARHPATNTLLDHLCATVRCPAGTDLEPLRTG